MSVITFDNKTDNENYKNWLHDNPTGYVLNPDRNSLNYLPLHRATCTRLTGISESDNPTGGTKIKICADSIPDLLGWIRERGGDDFSDCCSRCNPL